MSVNILESEAKSRRSRNFKRASMLLVVVVLLCGAFLGATSYLIAEKRGDLVEKAQNAQVQMGQIIFTSSYKSYETNDLGVYGVKENGQRIEILKNEKTLQYRLTVTKSGKPAKITGFEVRLTDTETHDWVSVGEEIHMSWQS